MSPRGSQSGPRCRVADHRVVTSARRFVRRKGPSRGSQHSDRARAQRVGFTQQPLSADVPGPQLHEIEEIEDFRSLFWINVPPRRPRYVCPVGLAPSACCAAVGWPCICFCTSCEDVATSPVARFMVLVGGCCLTSVLVPVVCPALPAVGPEPASFIFAARPVVSHGPACTVPALRLEPQSRRRENQ